jgi:hypothetical protein
MNELGYTKYTEEQLDKIGNTAIYLSKHIKNLSKTKFLKLIYILDEESIKASGIPFFNLQYKVWKYGPVADAIFIDLSSEIKLLDPFIKKDSEGHISPKKSFNDDEFSDNDIDLLNKVIAEFGKKNAKSLVSYTHRPDSLWTKKAKEKNVYDDLIREDINSTDFVIDLADLVADDQRKKAIYESYIEQF